MEDQETTNVKDYTNTVGGVPDRPISTVDIRYSFKEDTVTILSSHTP